MHLHFDIGRNPHTAQKHYIELIHRASTLYASWEPLDPIRVGDYGKLDDDYSFSREGNIFDNGIAARLGLEEQLNAEDDVRFILSDAVEEKSVSGGANGAYGSVHAGIKKSFQIHNNHAAILAMVQPRHHSLNFPGRLASLFKDRFYSNRIIVTELYTCYSYARLYAPKQEHLVELSLDGSLAFQGVQAGAREELHWQTTARSCDFKHRDISRDETQQLCYPLFKLTGFHHHFQHRPVAEARHDKDDDIPFDHRVAAIALPGAQYAAASTTTRMLW